ncbi:Ubiquitin- modifier 1, partial [Spiromyces aspiralis]
GGLETLFNNKETLEVDLDEVKEYVIRANKPGGKDMSSRDTVSLLLVRDLIAYLAQFVKPSERALFVDGSQLRAGILALINDTDWELEDKEQHMLEEGDTICFISTLHGG